MGKLNSYWGIAEQDYTYAKQILGFSKEINSFNKVVSTCAQAAGGYLKSIIEYCFTAEEDAIPLLRTHNLRAIYNRITTKYRLEISSKDCKWLGDFYFDTRYPGDNFVIASKEDAEECLQLVEIIRQDALRILEQEEKSRKEIRNKLKELSAFS